MEEKEMPKLEEIQEEQVEVKPNIEEGLKAIIESNDINKIKAIAKSLLGEKDKPLSSISNAINAPQFSNSS